MSDLFAARDGPGEAAGLDDAREHHNIVEIEHCIHYWDDASQL